MIVYVCYLFRQIIYLYIIYFVEQWNHPLTEWAQKKIQKRVDKSVTWTVRGIGYGVWEVRDHRRNAKVNMNACTCECLKWQVSGLPCGHAIAVARNQRCRDVSHLVTVPYFGLDNYKATYSGVIVPVGPPDTWLSPEVPLPTVRPPLVIKKRVGRPSNNERRPSHGEGRIQKKCSKCKQYGHTCDQCLEPAPSSLPRSSGSTSQDLEPHGTIRLDSLYHKFDFN